MITKHKENVLKIHICGKKWLLCDLQELKIEEQFLSRKKIANKEVLDRYQNPDTMTFMKWGEKETHKVKLVVASICGGFYKGGNDKLFTWFGMDTDNQMICFSWIAKEYK